VEKFVHKNVIIYGDLEIIMRKKCQKSQKSENTISTLCWENKGAREKFLVHSGACFVKICFLFLVPVVVSCRRRNTAHNYWNQKKKNIFTKKLQNTQKICSRASLFSQKA